MEFWIIIKKWMPWAILLLVLLQGISDGYQGKETMVSMFLIIGCIVCFGYGFGAALRMIIKLFVA